jgi:hypothetical protein
VPPIRAEHPLISAAGALALIGNTRIFLVLLWFIKTISRLQLIKHYRILFISYIVRKIYVLFIVHPFFPLLFSALLIGHRITLIEY